MRCPLFQPDTTILRLGDAPNPLSGKAVEVETVFGVVGAPTYLRPPGREPLFDSTRAGC